MYQLDLSQQFILWIFLGLIIFPIAGITSGVLLKYIAQYYTKISISFRRAIDIQLFVSFYCWLFMLPTILINQVVGNQTIWQSINGVAAILIGATCYSRMMKSEDINAIGFIKGLKLSAIMVGISIIISIPINVWRA